MKNLSYLFITICILGISNFCSAQKDNVTDKAVVIRALNKNASSSELSKAVTILSNRLKGFSSEKFDISSIPDKGSVKILLSKGWPTDVIEKLVLAKGELSFYETYSRQDLSVFNNDTVLHSSINTVNADIPNAIIGIFPISEVDDINKHLNNIKQPEYCLFAWEYYLEKNSASLYALKLSKNNGALISSAEVKSVKSVQEKASKNYEIEIKLKKEAFETWAKATRTNINKEIAIVLDGKVIYSPVLNAEITSGKCSITGNFDKNETKLLESIVNNGILPVEFEIVK
jgi:preprotein translocase subunit SecD